MRGAGDDHSSAQECVGSGHDPGPLGILFKHRNRNSATYYNQAAPSFAAFSYGGAVRSVILLLKLDTFYKLNSVHRT